MSIKESKNRIIYNDLYRKIRTGVYKKGEQLPTEFMLVEEYGISRPTVAKALNDLQEEGVIERKVGVGTFVKNIPEKEEERYMALLVPDIGRNEMIEPLYSQIARSCESEDYTLIWSGALIGSVEERIQQSFDFCRKYIRQKVAGIFLYPAPDIPGEKYHEMIRLFLEARIPVQILYQNLSLFPLETEHDFVGIDSYAVGYRIGRILLRNKTCHPAICWDRESPVLNPLMTKGFKEAAAEAGEPCTSLILSKESLSYNKEIEEIRKQGIDALFCTSDSLAADLMTDMLDAGLRIPEDIQIVGFGNTRYARHLKVSLSSVEVDWEEIGRMAVDLMNLRFKNPSSSPKRYLADGHLIERESTRC
jgi:GntR family transcriptional regulator, arabinose operon transcriptional repressor